MRICLGLLAVALATLTLPCPPVNASLSKFKLFFGNSPGLVPNTTVAYGEELYRGFHQLEANGDWVVAWRTTCGWEEVYVCVIELAYVLIAIFHEIESPSTLYLSTGNQVLWSRYAEWLLSCPVILIHLSNLTGMKDDYSKRTMGLLISDIGTIVFGTTAAMSPPNYLKVIFWFCGLSYVSEHEPASIHRLFKPLPSTPFLCSLCLDLAAVALQDCIVFCAGCNHILFSCQGAYHTVPKGICRKIVRFMAWDYFGSWCMFPILFVLGPEGFGHISAYGSVIAHQVLDITSKNIWSMAGHFLRVKIHEHIIVHGNITKKTKITLAGEPVEVEEYIDSNEVDPAEMDQVQDKGTQALAHRQSFLVMRNRMQQKAILDNPNNVVGASRPLISASHRHLSLGCQCCDAGDRDQTENGMGGGAVTMGQWGMGNKAVGDPGALGLGMVTKAVEEPAEKMGHLEPGRVILCMPDVALVDFWRLQFSSLPVPFEVYPAVGPDMTLQLVQQSLQLGGPSFCDFVLVAPDFLQNPSPSGLVGRLKMMGMRVAAYGWQPAGPMRQLVETSNVDGFLEGPTAPHGVNRSQFSALVFRMQQLKKMASMAALGAPPSMLPPTTSQHSTAVLASSVPNPLQSDSIPAAFPGQGLGTPTTANPLFSVMNSSPPSPLSSRPTVPAPMGAEGEAALMQQLMAEINQLRAELQQ
ncbi:channelopsin 1 [Haematococcus lacustris]|uniref:Channelopsin 1 n=1 Tax=Haematococcus lacustris TaxID=44745 RepID=A0A699YQR3_HAELA|nr:channelopsin 1 [Haematococcus lacustris]